MSMLLRLLDNVSIRRKFIMVYTIGILVPIVIGAVVWISFTSREIRQNTVHYLDQSFEKTAGNFNLLTQTAINVANQINADVTLRQDLSREFSTPVEHYEIYWFFLRNRFNMYLVSNPDIASITLYIDDTNFINVDHFRVLDDLTKQKEWYILASSDTSDFTIYPHSTAISVTPPQNRITIIRKVRSPDFLNNAVNYLLIELKLDRIISELNSEGESIDTYLTYGDNRIFWGTQLTNTSTDPQFLHTPSDDKYFILYKSIGTSPYFSDWKIYGIFDRNQINRRQLVVLVYILLITLSMAGLSVFIIWSVLNSMRYRLLALSSHIKKVGENYFEPLELKNPGKDEIGWLIIAFNKMITNINELINVVYKLEMQKKSMEIENIRAKYKYLQAQVDPHFLFNTLNAILVFCVKNNYTELSSVISSLSKLLKRLLTPGNDFITVSEEFDFIEKYLAIEKFRFGGKFEYEINISPEVINSGFLIPKMSIQPIVENACKHGLQASIDERRKLVLTAKIDSGALVISVKDNGAGMDKKQVEEILEKLKNPNSEIGSDSETGSGVGIQNVYRRMLMSYDKRFHFSINSSPGHGTEIIMRIEGE
ncbi:integral membrane sensor signal transduction histidine kinase [Thermoclostridium stercorarium subsp. stercorarium DSM 8532]|uniref:Integral membrane sensor signal transduction histidine kinase n=2 Tax=Thermoclostridium stercorarium TaxID=1510 RepID=L7VLT6_THES1|nr:histidine kinase [Thermoclostridium stercorarium]AGC67672.1 integral membrane sensor signal transduction histidine kinase [Thermoclostridium stercorarium subsp. stercorarium DSM 8532]AGI38719.1 signal transduction protein [Thermoclostridium stercorarium subsp. stercorarium DSM 8532]ANW98089.1 histidine kinase [Thermoclostridium stercorarium subsp. thermolacticum DSM 2910]UZQ86243.1 histidine kinase [Thermoclostridium stercorarium]